MSSTSKVVVGVLIKDAKTHAAWPPPESVYSKVSPKIDFVTAATASELKTLMEGPKGLLWVPGVNGKEAEECLESFESLQWLHSFSAGVDVLAPYLQKTNVACTNGRGAFSSSLAEYALSSALYFTKEIPRCQENLKTKNWETFRMPVLKGKTMGFVGYGNIAKETAKLAKAFGMKVIVVRRSLSTEDDLVDETYLTDEKLKIFEQADFVVCSLPGTAETRDYCGKDEFEAMKPDAVFISLGRGAAVDEDALYETLKADKIKGAALDVFKKEPLPSNSPLWSLPPTKLLFTAHNADLTDDYFLLGWNVWLSNLEAFLSGEDKKLITPFDPKQGY